jgi:hypothetical protein
MPMKKNTTVMFFAVINAIVVVLIAFSIFHYYLIWDESGPEQTKYMNSQAEEYKKYVQTDEYERIRLNGDETLLRIVNYKVLPANCLVMGISAILLWRCRNFTSN